jgi:SGNH hydrolase-like domain, acetyltransferase AlgX
MARLLARFVDRSFTVNAFKQVRRVVDWPRAKAPNTFGSFRDDAGTVHRVHFYDFYATRTFGEYERQRFETTMAAFRRGRQLCLDHNIRLVVFFVPIKFRVYKDFCTFPAGSQCPDWHPWDLETRFASFCRDANLECVSLTDAMRQAAANGQLLYAPEDSHWNAAGHDFVARQIIARLGE